MILRMFPPFPIPGFAPNFTGYDEHWLDTDWYEIHKAGHGLHWLDTDWYEIYTTGHGLV